MKMETCTFRVRGISPLLMNSAAAFTVAADEGPKTKSQRIPTPEAEAAAGAYWMDGAGSGLGFPAVAFRKAIISAAKGRKVGRLGLPGIVMSAVFETTELLPLHDPGSGEALSEYEIDVRGARPPGQGMVRRARPILHSWGADIDLEFDSEMVTPELIGELLADGGMRVGIGNYRPEKGGRYGRFEVVERVR